MFGDVLCYESCTWQFMVLGVAKYGFMSHWKTGYDDDGIDHWVDEGHVVAMGLVPGTPWSPGRLADITVGPMYHFTDL